MREISPVKLRGSSQTSPLDLSLSWLWLFSSPDVRLESGWSQLTSFSPLDKGLSPALLHHHLRRESRYKCCWDCVRRVLGGGEVWRCKIQEIFPSLTIPLLGSNISQRLTLGPCQPNINTRYPPLHNTINNQTLEECPAFPHI